MDHNNNFDDLTPEERAEATDKITRFGAILLALGIITYCFALAKLEEGFARFATSLFGCLIGGVGVFIIVVVLLASKADKRKHNFFLYDKKKKQDISVTELSVGEIRGRLTDFMAAFKFRGKLYDLGSYASLEDAVKARQVGEEEYFGAYLAAREEPEPDSAG